MNGQSTTTLETFRYGSTWLRADFHLHTKADREFEYTGDDNQFISSYIQKLKDSGIRVGVITNHNKFQNDEFKALRKNARKEEIFLLPGVELSVQDGSNGVHILVVFSDAWYINKENDDFINNFLGVTFSGQSNYYNENARSNHDLLETIRVLDGYNKDYFLLCAHVEENNGLWGGLSGGRIEDIGKNDLFRRRILGFQKVRTHDAKDHRTCRTKVQTWLKDWYPAEVEGSDCKSLDQIGRGETCYLKIGDFTFEAVKYALLDYRHRLSTESHRYTQSYIRSISFEGGVLNGQTISFSPELNALIGIRGSGKSSILEAVRYVLDIPFGEKAVDRDYKEALVAHTFASGGKAVIKALDRRGQEYEIRRILHEYADVYVNGTLQPGVKIRETILHKPIYFGQKDLSSTGEGFEKDLVEKLVGDKLVDIRQRIGERKQRIFDVAELVQKIDNVADQKKEYEGKKQDAEFRLKIYKEYGVEEKLQKQVDFDTDERKIQQILGFSESYLSDLAEFISRFEDELNNQKVYKSKQNEAFFKDFFAAYDKLITAFQAQKQSLQTGRTVFGELKEKAKAFEEMKKGLKEKFAEVERKLSDELKSDGAESIRPDEFLKLKQNVDQAKNVLEVLEKQESQRTALQDELLKAIQALNDMWHEEFKFIQSELNKINENQPSLKITAEYKGDKEAFVAFMKEMFRGSRIRENTFQNLADQFADFGAMYRGMETVKSLISGSADVFMEYFFNNLKSLLTWQPPNRYIISYHDKELKHHSLGQRASALILFVLSQEENDVIIIDQPEDDLDNQTIYEDVIKLIRSIKNITQFIFATHNPNFPVLGDAEQIHSCRFSDEKIELKSGSIDSPELQKEIVDIMEGGEEAFNRRKEIYQIWNPQRS